jgi:hypothetical protein
MLTLLQSINPLNFVIFLEVKTMGGGSGDGGFGSVSFKERYTCKVCGKLADRVIVQYETLRNLRESGMSFFNALIEALAGHPGSRIRTGACEDHYSKILSDIPKTAIDYVEKV